MNNNIDARVFQQRTSLNDYLGFNNANQNQTTAANNSPGAINSDLDGVFALWDSPVNSNTNTAFANINNLFADPTQMPRVETYGGFKFKNSNEQSAVDQALLEMRQAQAPNPGQKISKKIKVGKYKLTINLNEDGSVNIKRKKKRGGLFGKIGGFLKCIGNVLKKALPIISTVAMFIPGLQPLALAARVASGVMGVVNGIKSGSIFGAITSAVGAFSGIGGKISGAFSSLTSKASGLINSIGGAGSSWFSNAVNTASNFVSKAKSLWSGFTSNVGTRVSDFLFKNGSNVFGNWLNHRGSDLLRNVSNSMGNRAINWLNDRASNALNRLMDNPLGQRVDSFLNSGFGRFILESVFRRQA